MASIRSLPPTPYTHSDYPMAVYHPETGKVHQAAAEDDVPHGFLDRHPADVRAKLAVPSHGAVSPAAKTNGAAQPAPVRSDAAPSAPVAVLDRAAIIAQLRGRGIKFNARASTETLAGLLTE